MQGEKSPNNQNNSTESLQEKILRLKKLGLASFSAAMMTDSNDNDVDDEPTKDIEDNNEDGEGEEIDMEKEIEDIIGCTPEKLMKEINSFRKRNGRLFGYFAKDSSLNYEVDPCATTFSFEALSHSVNFPITWFKPGEHTEGEKVFAVMHELSHFLDMMKNPDAYLKKFEQHKIDGERLAEEFIRNHPDEKYSKEFLTSFYAKKLHTLYNCLDDIYVNHLVFSRSERFNTKDGRKDVHSLYGKIGFDKQDLTEHTLDQQFVFSLLRDQMVGEAFGKSIVAPEVQEELAKGFFGANSVMDLIEKRLKPRRNTKEGLAAYDPKKRYSIISSAIQPIYEDLLNREIDRQLEENKKEEENESNDVENNPGASSGDDAEPSFSNKGKNQQSSQDNGSQEGEEKQEDEPKDGNEQEGDPQGDKSKDNDPEKSKSEKKRDPFSMDDPYIDPMGHEMGDKEARDIIDQIKESKKIDEMNEQDRKEYTRKKEQKKWDEEHGINEKERQLDSSIRERIEAPRKAMRLFWKNIIGKAIDYNKVVVKNQTKGSLDTDSIIENYSDLDDSLRNGNAKLPFYERVEYERKTVERPERIEVSLVIDCSASMGVGNCIPVAREAAALLLYSLEDFNVELRSTRKTKLQTDSEVYLYSNNYRQTKSFKKGKSDPKQDSVEIVHSLSNIIPDAGTNDKLVLAAITNQIPTKDIEKIKQQKLKKIVFVITDGEPNEPEDAKKEIKRLAQTGTIVIGFEIGPRSPIFDNVWNQDSVGQKGIFVGDNIDSLPEALMEALKEQLGNIKF